MKYLVILILGDLDRVGLAFSIKQEWLVKNLAIQKIQHNIKKKTIKYFFSGREDHPCYPRFFESIEGDVDRAIFPFIKKPRLILTRVVLT